MPLKKKSFHLFWSAAGPQIWSIFIKTFRRFFLCVSECFRILRNCEKKSVITVKTSSLYTAPKAWYLDTRTCLLLEKPGG